MHPSLSSSLLRVLFLLGFPLTAFAHSETGSNGFIAGLSHPIFGMDHLLAMLSVGIVSAQMGGRSIWTVPSLFVLMMIAGGFLGANHIEFPFVEVGIAVSVIVLGLGIIYARKAKLAPLVIMVFVAFFGSLHGHAHGVEMPNSASPVYYSFGFVVSTSLIHLVGVLIGHTFTRHEKLERALAVVGGAVASAGIFVLYGQQVG
jgi:urease accessory protein